MKRYIQEIINYYKDLGYPKDKLEQLQKLLLEELQKIEITIVNPKGICLSEPEPQEQLGIPESDYDYHIITGEKSRREEVALTQEFLVDLPNKLPSIIHFDDDFEFINYGDTELVYVTSNLKSRNTVLVGQPINSLGTVKLEYENLKHLASKHPNLVISPLAYASNNHREAYITPYLHQARCIATYANNYGAYIPEPYYRFEQFTNSDETLITKIIIANLVRLYDEENKLALAECKIGGGDFVMEQAFDNLSHTEENALKHMKLIAARKLIKIEMKEYLELLKTEFQKRTYYRTIQEKDPSIIVNLKNRVPMSLETIEEGIELGMSLRKKQ